MAVALGVAFFVRKSAMFATMDKLSRLDDYLLEYCSWWLCLFCPEFQGFHRASFDKKSPVKKLNQKKESLKSVRAIANKRSFQKRERDKGQPAKTQKTRPSAEHKRQRRDS